MPDIQFTLAGIPLTDVQIPEKMPWGGAHRFNIHKLPGGKRVIDAMGPDNQAITWSGLFYGPEAVSIARVFDVLRQNGAPVPLQWDVFAFTVVIASFRPVYERGWQIPYEISCEIVADNTAPNDLSPDDVDDVIDADMTNSLNVAQDLDMTVPGDLPGPLSTFSGISTPFSMAIVAPAIGVGLDLTGVALALTTLRTRMATVTSFVGISASVAAPVAAAILGVQTAVSTQLLIAEGTLNVSLGIGGIVSGIDPTEGAAEFRAYQEAARQAAHLREMSAYLARMQANLAAGAL